MATATDAITAMGSKVPLVGKNRMVATVVGLVIAALIVYTVIAVTKPWGDMWGAKVNEKIAATRAKMKGQQASGMTDTSGQTMVVG